MRRRWFFKREKNQIMKGYLKWTWYSVMGVFIPKSKILVTTPKI